MWHTHTHTHALARTRTRSWNIAPEPKFGTYNIIKRGNCELCSALGCYQESQNKADCPMLCHIALWSYLIGVHVIEWCRESKIIFKFQDVGYLVKPGQREWKVHLGETWSLFLFYSCVNKQWTVAFFLSFFPSFILCLFVCFFLSHAWHTKCHEWQPFFLAFCCFGEASYGICHLFIG